MNYISVKDVEHVTKLTSILLTRNNLLCYINHIGGILNCLLEFSGDDYINSTDCIATARSIWTLFNPKVYGKIQVNENIPTYIFEYNIMRITIHNPYHKFILLKDDDQWSILTSYADIYDLNVIEVNLPFSKLNKIINGSTGEYYELFNVNVETNRKLLTIEYGYYDIIPTVKLQEWIDTYLRDNFT